MMEKMNITDKVDAMVREFTQQVSLLGDDLIMEDMDVLVREFACCPNMLLTESAKALKAKVIDRVDGWYGQIHGNGKTEEKRA